MWHQPLSSSVCGPVLTNEREPTKKENTAGGQAFSLRLVAHKERVFLAPSLGAEKGPSNKKFSKNVLSLLQQLGKEVDYFCKTAVVSSLQWNPQGFLQYFYCMDNWHTRGHIQGL